MKREIYIRARLPGHMPQKEVDKERQFIAKTDHDDYVKELSAMHQAELSAERAVSTDLRAQLRRLRIERDAYASRMDELIGEKLDNPG